MCDLHKQIRCHLIGDMVTSNTIDNEGFPSKCLEIAPPFKFYMQVTIKFLTQNVSKSTQHLKLGARKNGRAIDK